MMKSRARVVALAVAAGIALSGTTAVAHAAPPAPAAAEVTVAAAQPRIAMGLFSSRKPVPYSFDTRPATTDYYAIVKRPVRVNVKSRIEVQELVRGGIWPEWKTIQKIDHPGGSAVRTAALGVQGRENQGTKKTIRLRITPVVSTNKYKVVNTPNVIITYRSTKGSVTIRP